MVLKCIEQGHIHEKMSKQPLKETKTAIKDELSQSLDFKACSHMN